MCVTAGCVLLSCALPCCAVSQVRELIDQAVMDVECLGMTDPGLEKEDPAQLCFIAFLPDILDSKAEGRNGYIDALKTLAADYKDRCGCKMGCRSTYGADATL